MSENTFQAIRSICDAVLVPQDTTDQVVVDIRKLADANVADFGDYTRQLVALDEIRRLAHGRLGANDIDWFASGALDAIHDIANDVIGEDN